MEIETVTTQVHVLRLTDIEIERIIADPNEFAADLALKIHPNGRAVEKMLNHSSTLVTRKYVKRATKAAKTKKARKANAGTVKKPNWATDGYAGHEARGHAARGKKKTDKRNGADQVQCVCGDWFAPQGLGPHHRNCPTYQLRQAGEKAAAGVE